MFTKPGTPQLLATAIAVTAILSIASGPSMAGVPTRIPAAVDPLIVTAPFSIERGANLIGAVHSLAKATQVPINIVVLLDNQQKETLTAPAFMLSEGTYTVKNVLDKLQAASPDITWSHVGKCITVTFTLDPHVTSSLVNNIEEPVNATMSGSMWIRYLTKLNPYVSLYYSAGPSLFDSAKSRMDDPVTLSLPKGTPAIDYLNALSASTGYCYQVSIRDSATFTGYLKLPNGEYDTAHPQQGKLLGRAEVQFFDMNSPFI